MKKNHPKGVTKFIKVMESKQKEEGLSSEEMIGAKIVLYCPNCKSTEIKKCCFFCKETVTPLWRSGPIGPKSLCNACGIRYSKKRHCSFTTSSGSGEGKKKKKKKKKKTRNVKPKLMSLRKQVEGGPKEWSEVERAALLLMTLSCGAVFI